MEGLGPGSLAAHRLAADLGAGGGLPVRPLAAGTLTAGALVALGEVDRLVAGVVLDGVSTPASGAFAPSAAWSGAGPVWQRWAASDPAIRGDLAGWLGWHVALDLLLIAGYVALTWTLVGHRWRAPAVVVLLVAGVDLLENLLAIPAVAAVAGGQPPGPGLLTLLRSVTAAKWALAATLVGWLVACLLADRSARSAVARTARALFLQRFSVVVVVLLGLLVAVPRGEVFEQLPDVLRGWLDGPRGTAHALAATGALALLVGVLVFVGRMRARRAWEAYAVGWVPTRPSRPWAWVAVPLLVLAVGGLLAAGGLARLFPAQVLGFLAVPLALAAASLVVTVATRRWSWRHLPELAAATVRGQVDPDGLWVPPPRLPRLDLVGTTRVTGDALAVLAIAAAGVGLVRSFTAPALLGDRLPATAAAVVVGLVGAVAVWWPADRVLALDAGGLALGLAGGWRARRLVLAVLAGCALAAVLLLLWPLRLSAVLGVLGTVVLALAVLTAGLGAWVYVSQERLPLSIFRVFRLRATPILTVLLAIAVVASAPATAGLLHQVRTLPPDPLTGAQPVAAGATGAADQRPLLRPALDAWLGQDRAGDCVRTVTVETVRGGRSSVDLVPLLLVAAEGGGIRAATWTVQAMDHLQRGTGREDCAAGAVLLSSGVSGGAVGLALLDREADPAGAAERMAGPAALGGALAGLLAGDLLAGLTGVGVRALDAGTEPGSYADRAALMEVAWESDAGGLAERWAPPPADTSPGRAGLLVLNATSVAPACRVLIGQVDLGGGPPPAAAAGDGPACTSLDSTGPPASYDLRTAYGACLGDLRTSTAALLSARFTYVTPTGVVPGCGRRGDQQLVDGGYSEGSGLLTLLDALVTIRRPLQQHNDTVLGCATGRFTGTACAGLGRRPVVAVPLVVFLENHYRQDLSGVSSRRSNEVLAPSAAVGAREVVGGTEALLQRARDELARTAVCGDAGAACTDLVREAQAWTTRRVFVVSPRTRPQVEAPLGWVLSDASRESLAAAVQDAARPCAETGSCRPRVGGLGDLEALFAGLGRS